MSEQSRMRTSKAERWTRLGRFAFVIPVAVTVGFFIMAATGGELARVVLVEQDLISVLAFFILFFIVALIVSLPLMMIWRAVCRAMRKSARANATFNASEGIDFYREKLIGLTPVDISLLMDLEIEQKKDVTALILKYEMMGLVSFDHNVLRVVSTQHEGLQPSDGILLEALGRGTLVPEDLHQWQNAAFTETLQKGILEPRTASSGKGALRGCLGGCVVPFVLFMVLGGFLTTLLDIGNIDAFLDAGPAEGTNQEQIAYILSDARFLFDFGSLIFLDIAMIILLFWPLAFLIRTIVSASSTARIKRTEKGETLAEQIAGMKNFIHGFTNLPQAEKEKLIVWDDYLVYAVVLEENTAVMEEISQMRAFSYKTVQDSVVFEQGHVLR